MPLPALRLRSLQQTQGCSAWACVRVCVCVRNVYSRVSHKCTPLTNACLSHMACLSQMSASRKNVCLSQMRASHASVLLLLYLSQMCASHTCEPLTNARLSQMRASHACVLLLLFLLLLLLMLLLSSVLLFLALLLLCLFLERQTDKHPNTRSHHPFYDI